MFLYHDCVISSTVVAEANEYLTNWGFALSRDFVGTKQGRQPCSVFLNSVKDQAAVIYICNFFNMVNKVYQILCWV